MYETEIFTVPNKTRNMFSPNSKKHVGRVSSRDRGELVIAVCCMNAAGQYVPPALIFKRQRVIDDS